MDGIILVDKPFGKTSHQVVQIIKKKLGAQKVGHAGTLDPLATGLLVILINKATKLSNFFLSKDKTYEVGHNYLQKQTLVILQEVLSSKKK